MFIFQDFPKKLECCLIIIIFTKFKERQLKFMQIIRIAILQRGMQYVVEREERW